MKYINVQDPRYFKRLLKAIEVFFTVPMDQCKKDEDHTSNRALQRIIASNNYTRVAAPEDMRKALRIAPAHWNRLMAQFIVECGRVASYGAARYMDCLASATDGEQVPKADLEALKQKTDEEIENLKATIERNRKEQRGPVDVKVIPTSGKPVVIKQQHVTMPALLARIAGHVNVYLVGPAGSGKTTAAEMVAKALSLEFGFMSVGPQTTKSDILGYMNATGVYVPTEFRRRYEKGGLFLFDEIDAANAGVLTSINAALAGSMASFPDKMIKRHPDFRCLAAGNTYGTGADRVYVGRNELDGASLDRFDFLEWGYDEGLELAMAKAIWEKDEKAAQKWCEFVQAARAAIAKLGIRHIVSPRATVAGIKIMQQGIARHDVVRSALWKNLKNEDIERIEAQMGSIAEDEEQNADAEPADADKEN